ncbi:MAG: hypothetical protein ACJA1B_001251 [Polaribacter sp.]|jgi:hypothetical protein
MELTKEQTQKVENYLYNKNFDFIDLKDEILDHMVSDIENKMSKNISFENAFKMMLLKWDTHFRDTSSFFFGMMYSNSKIVVKKAVKLFKPFYFLYLAAYILPVAFLKLFPVTFSESIVDFINGFLLSFSIVMLGYMLFIFIRTRMTKVKTTYRFILSTQYFGLILLIMGLSVGIFNDDGMLNPVFTGFVSGGYAIVFICHYFYKKHQEAIQKYKVL